MNKSILLVLGFLIIGIFFVSGCTQTESAPVENLTQNVQEVAQSPIQGFSLVPADYGFEDYPAPFSESDFTIVVGSDALQSDLMAATAIGVGIQAAETQDSETQPFVSSLVKTDKELTDSERTGNLIIIGGPDINRLTAEIANVTYPAGSYCESILSCAPGAAVTYLYKNPFNLSNDSTILIIIGDATSRGTAAKVLENYQSYKNILNGQSLLISSENGVIKVELGCMLGCGDWGSCGDVSGFGQGRARECVVSPACAMHVDFQEC